LKDRHVFIEDRECSDYGADEEESLPPMYDEQTYDGSTEDDD
jgi:hypothetical protein